MRRFMVIVWAGLSALLISENAAAQTGPLAPGAELLTPDLRHWAETPLVLTPASAPNFCLDMSDQDPVAQTVQTWTCTPRWNQKVWVEPISNGSGDQFRIRIGELACLLDSGRPGTRATMGICNDAPAAEPWTTRDGLLVGASGLCLDAQNAADGTAVIASACNAAAPNQQWRLEAMRTALGRQPPDRFDPSGFGEYYYSGYVPEMVEAFRPRFTPRKLTSAERAEIKKLMSPWRKLKPLDIMFHTSVADRPKPVSISWPTLRRLSELAESGDKEAMHAVMTAFYLIRDTNFSDTFPGWEPEDFPHADNSRLAHGLADRLAQLWSAHYLQKHGPDRLAAYAFAYCQNPHMDECMGYAGKVEYPKPTGNVMDWVVKGDAKYAVTVKDITFHPARGTYAERQKKFISILDASAFTSLADFESFDQEERAEQAVFAEQTGQLALWDNVRLNSTFEHPNFTSYQEAHMRTVLQERAAAADWRSKFEAFMAAPDEAKKWWIEAGLITASENDMLRFADQHVVMDEKLSERLCGSGREATLACQRSRQGIAARRAEYDAYIAEARVKREAQEAVRYAEQQAQAAADEAERARLAARYPPRKPDFWDQLAGLAEGFAAAAEAGNDQVTVRTYDSAGNYTGSETMSRARAAGLGAQPSN